MSEEGVMITIVGCNFNRAVAKRVELGDSLAFMPEPTNVYDIHAIQVFHRGKLLGHVKKTEIVIMNKACCGLPMRCSGTVVNCGRSGLCWEMVCCLTNGMH